MRRFVCGLFVLTGVMSMTCGCGSGNAAPKLPPEVAKQRQNAYESKMRDGAPRGGKPGDKGK